MDIELALEEIGGFGIWQIWVYFWIFYSVCFFAAINLCIVFMQDIPKFICANPLTKLTNWTFDDIRSISTPKHEVGDYYNGCKSYKRNYTALAQVSGFNFTEAYSLIQLNQDNTDLYVSNDTISCSQGPYDWHIEGGMHLSIANQWNLVCDSASQISNTSMVYMIGFFFGCFCASFLADRFGRLKVIVIGGTLGSICSVVDPWIPNFYAFMVVRFCLAFCLNLVSPTLYVLSLEICTDAARKPLGALYFIAYSVGYTGLAGVAYFIRDWRLLHTIVGAPMLIAPLFYFFLPESPRWLLSQGREKEARSILENAAKWNRKKTAPEIVQAKPSFTVEVPPYPAAGRTPSLSQQNTVPNSPEQIAESTNFFIVFTHWRLALRTLNIFFNWIVNAFVYYGISYLITSFSGSIFVNNAIAGALETPAYLLCYPLLLWARKKSLMILLLIAGVSCLLYLAVPTTGVVWAQLLVAFIGKLAITASFNLIYLVTHELYPTSIRGASVALSSMAGRLGSITAPYVVLIAQKNKALIWVSMVVFGAFSLAAGVLTVFLPESQNQPLPETLDEAINYPPKRKKKDENLVEMSKF